MTDSAPEFARLGKSFEDHHVVNHKAKEYVREDWDGHLATTNTAEGFFGNMKRTINGTHHQVSKKHLPKYLEEIDFKYNTRGKTDTERAETAVGNISGKRLTLFKSANPKTRSLYDKKPGETRKKRPVKKRKSTTAAKPELPLWAKQAGIRANRDGSLKKRVLGKKRGKR